MALTDRAVSAAATARAASHWRRPAIALWAVSRLVLLANVVLLGHWCDRVFWVYGHDAVIAHMIPYRGFHPEYPPLAVALFMLPAVARTYAEYAALFAATMLAVDAVAVLVVRSAAEALGLWDDGWRAALGYILLSFATTATLVKFDLVPALLTLVAVVALVRGRERAAWAALAAAVLFKGYAVVLVPLFLLYRYRARGRAGWWRGPLAGAAVAAVVLLPVAIVAPAGVAGSVLYHAGRGLELESLYASVVLLAHQVAHLPAWVTPGRAVTSRDIHSSLNGALAATAPWLLAALLAATYGVAWRRLHRGAHPAPDAFLLLCMAAVTAFMLAFKALPSYYLLWLLPMAALVLGRPGAPRVRLAAALVLAIALGEVVTGLWLPLRLFDPLATAAMVGRNLAIIATFVLLLVESCR